jgi:hypothetical protein
VIDAVNQSRPKRRAHRSDKGTKRIPKEVQVGS